MAKRLPTELLFEIIKLLPRDSLKHIHATHQQYASSWCNLGATFPNVHKSTLVINFSTMTQNLVILSKFPAVCELHLSGWGPMDYESTEEPAVRASDVLLLLREYRGGCPLLHLFLPKPTLARLFIDFCRLEALTFQLRGEYNHITTLHATVHNLDQDALSTIWGCFPGLTELRIRVYNNMEDGQHQDVNPRATEFFSTFADTPGLPPTLKRLAISWQFEFSFFQEDVPVASPESIPDGRSLGKDVRR